MNKYKKLFVLGLVLVFSLSFVGNIFASTPTLSISPSGSNNVMINVSGDPNSNVVLYYNLSYGTQSITLGATNSSGFLSTYLSTNSYSITTGSLVYVIVNNQQSVSVAWPSSYSTFTLSSTNLSLSSGQTSYVTANNNFGTLYVASNSNPSVATASISGNTISVYGNASGSTSFSICQSGNTSFCSTLYVTVSGGVNYGTNSGINVSNLSLSVGNSITFTSPSGGSLYVSNNSNPSVATTSNSTIIAGCYAGAMYSTLTGQPCYYNTNIQVSSNSLTITALSYGTTTVTLCQNNNISACNTFTINVNNNAGIGSVLGASTGLGCYIGRTLRYGMYGNDISCLQSLLSSRGYTTNSSSYFDQSTYNAVILFQRANYLSADGIVGRMTRERLMSSVMY